MAPLRPHAAPGRRTKGFRGRLHPVRFRNPLRSDRLSISNIYRIMISFTQIPADGAPLADPVVYVIGNDEAGTVLVRISRQSDGELLGAKRISGETSVAVDAAPCLRRAVRFIPAEGPTGVYGAEDRMVRISLRAKEEESASGTILIAPVLTCYACRAAAKAPALLTSMPLSRILSPGECDELTLLTAEACPVTVTAQTGAALQAESYAVPERGLRLFRIAADDFPEAEVLTVDAGSCGTVVYTLVPPPHGAVRLAWRSSAGSIEHYTFPVVRTVRVAAEKIRGCSADGYEISAPATERRLLLVSALERPEVLEALAELTATPEVWFAEPTGYRAADVLSDEAVVCRCGGVGTLEIEIRPKRKTDMPWN